MRRQNSPLLLAALLIFINLTFVFCVPIPPETERMNCASCHNFEDGDIDWDGKEELSKRQVELSHVDGDLDRNVGGKWFLGLKSLGERTDPTGWSSAGDKDVSTLKESGWNHAAQESKMVRKGFITVDAAPADISPGGDTWQGSGPSSWEGAAQEAKMLRKDSIAADIAPDDLYPSGSWRRRWKGQEIGTGYAGPADIDASKGEKKQQKGLITADFAPADMDPSGGGQRQKRREDSQGGQTKQKRGFITVDVTRTEDSQRGTCVTCV